MPNLLRWLKIVRVPRASFAVVLRLAGAVFSLGAVRSGVAQTPTGTLVVTVRREDSIPLRSAIVRADRIGATTDAGGTARLELPARLVAVAVSYPGYVPRVFEITIVSGLSQRFDLLLERETAAARRVNTGRAIDSAGGSARQVETLGPDDVERAAQVHPADLTRLLPAELGVHAQQQSGALDGTRLRLDGLRGQYTGVLVDGLPLLGQQPGAFGALHLGPFEFSQAELLPGAAGAIYGPTAAAGAINLISRRPERDQARLGINQSSEKGGDLMFWGGRRQSATLSGSLTASLHQQRLVDADDDGWGEFPRAVGVSVRPRVFIERPNGDALTATAGFLAQERVGGYLFTNTGVDLYREERRTQQVDGAVTASKNLGRGATLRFDLTMVFQANTHKFDERLERDRRSTVATDVSVLRPLGQGLLVVGLGYWRDGLRERDFPAFDYTASVPGLFAEFSTSLGEHLRAVIAGRCDDHNIHGLQCVPRLDLRYRTATGIDIAGYGGQSYTSPTPLTDEVETLGLRSIFPVALKAERIGSAGLSARRQGKRWDVRIAAGYDRVRLPLRLVPIAGDSAGRLRLLNVAEPTRVVSASLAIGYRAGPISARSFYRFQDATEGVPGSIGRRQSDLTPRHQLGAAFNWRSPAGAGTEIQVEGVYVGAQSLTDNPFLTRSPAYPLASALVSQRSGRARIYLSAENLFDKKLRGYQPVVLTVPELGSRRTTSPWVPVRGREISLGALIDW